MQSSHHDSVSRLIFELSKLPGIGEKTAARLTHFILRQNADYAQALSHAILNAKQKTILCQTCLVFTDINPCKICTNLDRHSNIICVVERPTDVLSIENSGIFRGYYHVLHGALSPLEGIGPEELKIKELLFRISQNSGAIKEIILATNPSIEGEATALYLSKMIKPLGIKVTQLAHGLPVGGLLEYSDRQTIGKALENRVEIS
jgi:recombination protein RecR